MTVELTRALCWAQYNVSVAYGNTNGNSSWSSALILRGPLDGEFREAGRGREVGRGREGGRGREREGGREKEGGREGGRED